MAVHDLAVESAVMLPSPRPKTSSEPCGSRATRPRRAAGIPAHVTLIYPFVPDPDAGVVEELRFFFSRRRRLRP